MDILARLLGADIRMHKGGKINIKAGGHGAPVEWHQDWAFYPHTNDDVLAIGLLLDDVGSDNAPLLVLPGTHTGPTFDHHSDGAFCGAMDPAASEFYEDGAYVFSQSDGSRKTAAELGEMWSEWITRYPLLSLEDGFSETDHEGWKTEGAKLSGRIQLVGDDLFVTNPGIFKKGIADGLANSILIKLNQIGTVTETLECIEIARQNNYTFIISHRSGETEDTTIADLAVAAGGGQIKTGSACRSDRVAKYNRLLQIEAELGDKARYAGKQAFARWVS